MRTSRSGAPITDFFRLTPNASLRSAGVGHFLYSAGKRAERELSGVKVRGGSAFIWFHPGRSRRCTIHNNRSLLPPTLKDECERARADLVTRREGSGGNRDKTMSGNREQRERKELKRDNQERWKERPSQKWRGCTGGKA